MKRTIPALLLGAALALAPVVPAHASTTVTAVTLNAYGAKGNHGKTKPVAELIRDTATRSKADIIGVQELCYDQYLAARKLLEPKGYQFRFATATFAEVGCAKNQYGNAIIVKTKTTIKDKTRTNLPNVTGKQGRVVLCESAKVKSAWIRICNAHLDYTAKGNAAQNKALVTLLGKEKRGSARLVFTGDVNYGYAAAGEKALAKVLPGEKRPGTAASVDRVKSTGTHVSSKLTRDARTDHLVYAAVVRFR